MENRNSNEESPTIPVKTRYFKVITNPTNPPKRFTGNTPDEAAFRALCSLMKEFDNNVEDHGKIPINEVTKGSQYKTYDYVVEDTTNPPFEIGDKTYQLSGKKIKLENEQSDSDN